MRNVLFVLLIALSLANCAYAQYGSYLRNAGEATIPAYTPVMLTPEDNSVVSATGVANPDVLGVAYEDIAPDEFGSILFSPGIAQLYSSANVLPGDLLVTGEEEFCVRPYAGDDERLGIFAIALETIQDIETIPISSYTDLKKIGVDPAYPLDGNYIMTQDIDASASATENPEGEEGEIEYYGFVPIGVPQNNFTGTLNGQGFSITDLFSRTNPIAGTGLACLFAYNAGTLKNINVVDAYIVEGISILCGFNMDGGLVQNCHVYSASGAPVKNMMAGLVYFNSGTVQNCSASADVGNAINAGGLVGTNDTSGVISASFSFGTVSVAEIAGGLVGLNGGDISNCFSVSAVSNAQRVGGLVGSNSAAGSISYSYAAGAVYGSPYVGGLVGKNDNAVTACYYDSETTGQSDTGKGEPLTTEQMKLQASFVDWDFTDVWEIDETISYPTLQVEEMPPPEPLEDCKLINVFLLATHAVQQAVHTGLFQEGHEFLDQLSLMPSVVNANGIMAGLLSIVWVAELSAYYAHPVDAAHLLDLFDEESVTGIDCFLVSDGEAWRVLDTDAVKEIVLGTFEGENSFLYADSSEWKIAQTGEFMTALLGAVGTNGDFYAKAQDGVWGVATGGEVKEALLGDLEGEGESVQFVVADSFGWHAKSLGDTKQILFVDGIDLPDNPPEGEGEIEPLFTFGDVGTGVYRPAANQLGVAVGGSFRAKWDEYGATLRHLRTLPELVDGTRHMAFGSDSLFELHRSVNTLSLRKSIYSSYLEIDDDFFSIGTASDFALVKCDGGLHLLGTQGLHIRDSASFVSPGSGYWRIDNLFTGGGSPDYETLQIYRRGAYDPEGEPPDPIPNASVLQMNPEWSKFNAGVGFFGEDPPEGQPAIEWDFTVEGEDEFLGSVIEKIHQVLEVLDAYGIVDYTPIFPEGESE